MIIKALLILGALGFGVLILRDRVPGQHLALRRIAGLLVVVLGILAVLWPNLTTRVANAVGVGRGTDLVLYVLVMVFIYYAVATSQRLHQLERRVLDLSRAHALHQAAEHEAAAQVGQQAADAEGRTP